MRLSRSFFAQATRQVARALLGCRLVRLCDGQRLSGIVVETEAYIGETDLACHARAGCTARTAIMYGRPGLAYVYFTYGMHWMLNVVSEPADFPAAVLIRAIEPQEGLAQMLRHRPVAHPIDLCRGPAKLTQALRIDQALNGVDLCSRRSVLWIEAGGPLPARSICCGPRVGLNLTPEPWKSKPWRYWVADNKFVSH